MVILKTDEVYLVVVNTLDVSIEEVAFAKYELHISMVCRGSRRPSQRYPNWTSGYPTRKALRNLEPGSFLNRDLIGANPP